MTSWSLLVGAAVVSGLVLCVVVTVIMAFSSIVALDMWVDNYPPGVRTKYGPMSDRGRRIRPFVAAAVFIAMLGVPLVGLLIHASRNVDPGFVPAFVFGFVALLSFNVYDLLVLDFFVFSTWQPRFIVLPGTEGMAEYRDYRFHIAGFFRGLVFCFVGGLVVAVVALVL